MIKVDPLELRVGFSLPWAVYDKYGKLLRRAGFSIENKTQLHLLIQRPLYRNERDETAAAVTTTTGDANTNASSRASDELSRLKDRLHRLYSALASGQREEGALRALEEMAQRVIAVVAEHEIAALIAAQIDDAHSYEVSHVLHAAVLCAVIGQRAGLPTERHLRVVQAALSYDIGLWPLRGLLNQQRGSLSGALWTEVRAHPFKSSKVLREIGVRDDDWLAIVLHHHERQDGSGYPEGLRGDQVPYCARLIAVADSFSAMVRPRPHREPIASPQALRELFSYRGTALDANVIDTFIKHLGLYPPGTFVRLQSGDIAVVARPGSDIAHPEVRLLKTADGRPIPPERQQSECADGIIEGIQPTPWLVQQAWELMDL